MRVLGCLFLAILFVAIIFVPLANADEVNVSPNITPFITIDPIGNHTIGDVFFINGTTNMPVSENLTISFERYIDFGAPHAKNNPDHLVSISDIPISSAIPGTNRWSVNVTDFTIKHLLSTQEVVFVYTSDVYATDIFTLFPANKATPSNDQTTVLQTIIPSPPPIQSTTSAVTALPTTRSSPLSLGLPIVVLAAVVILRPVYRKNRD